MKGDGSTYTRTDTKGRTRWVAQLFVEGRQHPVRRTLPVGATKRQAQAELRRMQGQRARGELAEKAKEAVFQFPTLGEWMDRWVTDGCGGGPKKRKRRAGPSTRDMYARLIRLDIAPSSLARLRLDQVWRSDVDEFLQDRANAGRSASTLTKELGAMARAWDEALTAFEKRRVLQDRANPFTVALPDTVKEPAERRALDAPEIRSLLDASADHRLLAAWVPLGIDCGARPSELAALEWADFDLEASPATVTIVKTIVWEPRPAEEPGDGRQIARLSDGKTGRAGWRMLTLSPSTVEALRGHKRAQAAEKLAVPGHWPTEQDGIDLSDRLFRTTAGKLVHFSTANHALLAVAERAGLGKVNPYDLRHTAATLIEEHHGEETASKALGHASKAVSATTAGYIHKKRLRLVESACLDVALGQADKPQHDQAASQ